MSSQFFSIQEHILPCQYIREYPGATLDDQESTLLLHIKQYKPVDQSDHQPGAVTVIGAHANGFAKELYEPLWDDIYQAMKSQGQAIRGIWIADVSHQGRSGMLNQDKLGNDPYWGDHPRDLLHMINHFRSEMARPLVGIGHSMGANHLVSLSYIHPRLLSSVVLIDPVIHDALPFDNFALTTTRASTFRKDWWPSKTEARVAFGRSKFYQAWDPRVFDLWMRFGLQELSAGSSTDTLNSPEGAKAGNVPVTLATSKHQEVFTFARPKFGKTNRQTHPDFYFIADDAAPFYRSEAYKAFVNLPHLRPSALYIFGGKSVLSAPDQRRAKMDTTGLGVGGSGGIKEGRVKEVVFEDIGHLVPLEIPERCADATATWLTSELKYWISEEERWKREWSSKTKDERTLITEEWKAHLGGNPRRKPNQKL